MERDPVCGMMVDPDDAADTATYQGKTFYFCSEDCREKFDKSPAEFAKKAV